ncbi:serine protease [Reinekea forsetii]|nr:serine protease [Reinekea forsetii]
MNKLFAFILCLPLFAFAVDDSFGERGIAPRIINGSATAANEHEYFVALLRVYNWADGKSYASPGNSAGYSWNAFCGASHIGGGKVVTAAHCVDGYPAGASVHLLIGDYSNVTTGKGMQYEFCKDKGLVPYDCIGEDSKEAEPIGYHFTGYTIYTGSETPIEIPSENIEVHPLYNSATLEYDIAILHLPQVSNKPSLALPTMDLFDHLAKNTSSKVQVIGHGDTLSDNNDATFSASAQLLDVDLTPRTVQECNNSNIGNNFDAFTMICAGDPGYDSCQGDSGGPLIDPDTDTLLGVVSWGPSQCGINSANAYGVYSNVYNLRDWINEGSLSMDLNADTTRNSDGQVSRLGAGSLPMFGMIALAGLLWAGRRRG